MTDWETRYYEQQAMHTESNGMLAMERDHWKAKAEGLRESMRLDAETMAAKDRRIAELENSFSDGAKLWECPECCFRFDAGHTDPDGTYSCPVCAEGPLRTYAVSATEALEAYLAAKPQCECTDPACPMQAARIQARAVLAKKPIPQSGGWKCPACRASGDEEGLTLCPICEESLGAPHLEFETNRESQKDEGYEDPLGEYALELEAALEEAENALMRHDDERSQAALARARCVLEDRPVELRHQSGREIEVLRVERDQARAREERAFAILMGIFNLCVSTRKIEHEGKVYVFEPKDKETYWPLYRALCDRIHAIPDELAALRPQVGREASPWVPVEERVPTDDRGVLVHLDGGARTIGVWSGCAWYNERGRAFADLAANVTHWMPVPPISDSEFVACTKSTKGEL